MSKKYRPHKSDSGKRGLPLDLLIDLIDAPREVIEYRHLKACKTNDHHQSTGVLIINILTYEYGIDGFTFYPSRKPPMATKDQLEKLKYEDHLRMERWKKERESSGR